MSLQVNSMIVDFDRKLAAKAETKDIERAVPARMDEILRNFSNQISDLKSDVARTASKEDFHALNTRKVWRTSEEHILLSLLI